MSKLMWIAGILLIALGVALGLMVFVSTASIVAWGIDLHVAVSLVIGGILSLGLGSVISGLDVLRIGQSQMHYTDTSAPSAAIPEFGRRSGVESTTQISAVAAVASEAAHAIEVSEPTKETIEALEEARQKIEQAFDPKPTPETTSGDAGETPVVDDEKPVSSTAEAESIEDEEGEPEVVSEGQLYVVEERVIRARPARILSDGTVEAETEEGWMRFENLEHLDEYLDAMSPSAN